MKNNTESFVKTINFREQIDNIFKCFNENF